MDRLVKKAVRGDAEAFAELIRRNKQSMYKMAWIYLQNEDDIADALQDTILSCYEKISTLREPRYFKTWMTRILINKCTDILRRKTQDRNIQDIQAGQDCWELERCEWKQLLLCLDEGTQKIVEMYYFDEFSIREIGEMLGMNKNTVATRLSRARKTLQRELGR